MDPHLQSFVDQLHKLSQDMLYSLVGDEVYEVYAWDAQTKGPFSLASFLIEQEVLVPCSWLEWLEGIEELDTKPWSTRLIHFLTDFRKRQKEIYVYEYGFPQLPQTLYGGNLPIDQTESDPLWVPLLMVYTQAGEWIGAIPKQGYSQDEAPSVVLPKNENLPTEWEEIKLFLEELYPLSWSGSWKRTSTWKVEGGQGKEETLVQLLQAAGYLYLNTLPDFFRLESGSEEEVEEISDEGRLYAFFSQHCDAHRVISLDYNIGGESWRVHYALGKIQGQHQIGVQTVSFTF